MVLVAAGSAPTAARRWQQMITMAHSHHDLTMRLRSMFRCESRRRPRTPPASTTGTPVRSHREIGSDAHLERYDGVAHDPRIVDDGRRDPMRRRDRSFRSSGTHRRQRTLLSVLSARRCVRSRWSHPAGLDFVHGRPQSADVRQISVTLGVVEPVADDELVRDVEADVLATVTSTLIASGLRSNATTSHRSRDCGCADSSAARTR